MCGVCGCGKTEGARLGPLAHARAHSHEHGHGHEHGHEHWHAHEHEHAEENEDNHAHGDEHSHSPAPALAEEGRRVRVERDILEKNGRFAALNRRLLAATRTLALNLVSSPGSGKTTLLVRTLSDLAKRFPLAVIEGDQQTSLDADRIKATGAPALQINTGKVCHLDASMISEALGQMPPPEGGVLFVENVGNLVCPAGFDLGEARRVVLASVTEGEDKPLKYPDIFYSAALVLVTKVDLLPHLTFDVAALIDNVKKTNPRATVLQVSAATGNGMDDWYRWIEAERRGASAP